LAMAALKLSDRINHAMPQVVRYLPRTGVGAGASRRSLPCAVVRTSVDRLFC
jgi:hypothetical protein